MLSLIGLLFFYHYIFVRPVMILALMSTSLVADVYAVSDSNKRVIMAAIIGLLVFAFMLADFVQPSVFFNFFSGILLAGFYTFTLVNILVYVIRGQKVTKDKIYGALSVYLLIGFAWAPLYRLVFLNDPSAFSGAQSLYEGIHHFDFIYYSFSTICTLGFGDITPVSGIARSLSILEATTGVFYMAVMISRLVFLKWRKISFTAMRFKNSDFFIIIT
jgi:hypothetical protein